LIKKLIIVMANSDPRNSEELGAPIFQASVAAAMEYEVDVVCTATSSKLMRKGVAEQLPLSARTHSTLYHFIKEACQAGVKFYCCSPNLDSFDMRPEDLIPECAGIIGGGRLIEEIMEKDVKVLTY